MSRNKSEILTPSGTVERVFVDSVGSTNKYAMNLLRDKEQSGKPFNNFYVVTKDQTLGKGQRGNRWSSNKGQDLAMSWVVNTPPKVDATVFNMAVALAIINGVREAVKTGVPRAALALKWPNDLMLWSEGGHRKLAGLLVENHWRGEKWAASVVGIGVNVMSMRLVHRYHAISITDSMGEGLCPEDLEMPIITQLEKYTSKLIKTDVARYIINEYNSELYGRNEMRHYIVGGNKVKGVLLRIEQSGKGVFKWTEGQDYMPPSELHSSEVKWLF
jgi:BirA family biotin operon repressor/biotin-[acetyl-CoA-carboxylase] ligase